MYLCSILGLLFCRLQVLVLTVEGRVLTADHMRAGLFIQPSEAALASSLLQGGAWLPPAIPQPAIAQPLGGPLPISCCFS